MDATSAIRQMLATSGLSARAASSMMGMNNRYVGGILFKDTVPKVDTLAAIADVCGYDLILMPRDGACFIVIDNKEDNG